MSQNPLNAQMEEILEFVHRQIVNTSDDWRRIGQVTATQFHLLDDGGTPQWLGYVVQGLLNEFRA